MSRSSRPGTGSRRLARLLPVVEGLEARALMAFSGVFDTTFNGSGYYTEAVQPPANFTNATADGLTDVAVQSNGAIVVGGQVGPSTADNDGLIRLNANGTLDTSFGQGGTVITALPSGINAVGVSQVLIQPDGKIVVLETVTVTGSSPAEDASLVFRFNTNGSLDTTFGTSGEVILDSDTIGVSNATFDTAALQSNGQIVVAGTTPITTTQSTYEFTQVAVVRLDANGTVDTTYGTGGLVTISSFTANQLATLPYGALESADALAIDAEGRAVLSATSSAFTGVEGGISSTTYNGYVFRLNTNGSVDPTLGQSGLQASGIAQPLPNGLLVEPSGEILVAGYGNPEVNNGAFLAGLNPDGTLQASAKIAGALALQADGKILVSGTTGVSRLNPNLTPDLTFGTIGHSNNPFPVPSSSGSSGSLESVNALAIASNGSIVLAGTSETYSSTGAIQAVDDVVAQITSTGFPPGRGRGLHRRRRPRRGRLPPQPGRIRHPPVARGRRRDHSFRHSRRRPDHPGPRRLRRLGRHRDRRLPAGPGRLRLPAG